MKRSVPEPIDHIEPNMESIRGTFNPEEARSLWKSFLLTLTGAAGGYVALGVFPEVSLVLSIGDNFSVNLVPVISAGVPWIVNFLRLWFRGRKA